MKTKEEDSAPHAPQEASDSPGLKVKNKWIYYGAIFDVYFFKFVGSLSIYNLSIFMDTISNEHNFGFSKYEREFFIGIFTSAFYIGSAVGSLSTGFCTRFDTRIVYAITRIGNSLALIMFTYPNVWTMVLARFFMGCFYDASHAVAAWSLYEILLPRHRERALTLFYAVAGVCYFCCVILALYDPGSWSFWRLGFIIPSLAVIVEVLLSFVIFPKYNTLTYLVNIKGEEKAIETLNYYFEEETAKQLVEEFKRNQLSERDQVDDIEHEDNENTGNMIEMDFLAKDSSEEPQKFQNDNSRSVLNEENNQLSECTGGFLADFRAYRAEAVHIIVFTTASMLAFHDTYYLFSVYYGSKNLSDKEAVSTTKHFLVFASITKVVSSFLVGIFNWSKKRKLCLLISHLGTVTLLAIVAYAFYVENLEISRYCLVFFPLFTAGICSVNDIYSNDVGPPSLYAINHMIVRGASAIFGLLIPLYIHFEILSFQAVAIRLVSLVVIGVFCFFWLLFNMIETDGLNKRVIRAKLKGE